MKHFQVTRASPRVAHIKLVQSSDNSNPSKSVWEELRLLFIGFSSDPKTTCIILSSTLGFGHEAFLNPIHDRDAREQFDSGLAAVETCTKAVICIISGECSRIGLSLALSCDVRIAVEGTTFVIFGNEKISDYEIRLLQQVLRYSQNSCWTHKIIVTAGQFSTNDALENGIISNAYRNSADAMSNALGLAKTMSMRDPDSTVNTKLSIARARDPRFVFRAAKARYPEKEMAADIDFALGLKSKI
ncbi:hypothetical protein VTN00DRAFT_3467 [Thermoascus crustaceus]|uniref:uncharacterized protein n=1 Tax=Thermoascus crustaceus TaxID=5088 RepID=UPI003743672D